MDALCAVILETTNFTQVDKWELSQSLEDGFGHYEFWTYIHAAGFTIDLYDAATYRNPRTIALDGDMTTTLHVVPE